MQDSPDAATDASDTPDAPAETATHPPLEGSLAPMPSDDREPGRPRRESAFMGVPIEVMISVGKARPLVSELVKLRRDSVVTLNSKIEDPVELYIGERLIARGELQEMDDGSGRLAVRLTEVADLSKGV